MSYSWYNIAEVYDKNKIRWRKKSENWQTLTFPDGMYSYSDINSFLQTQTGRVDLEDKDSEHIFTLYFNMAIYRVVILIRKNYELDLSRGQFAKLVGFQKAELSKGTNFVGKMVPNTTKRVDWVFLHCDLITRQANDVGSDVLFSFSTVQRYSCTVVQLFNGTARRIVVRKFELWVPQLQFTGKGQKFVNENFLKPTQWKYLKEMLHLSSSRRDVNGRWLITPTITPGVKNPRHVFVFFQQTQKQKAFTQNPYIFDTFDLDGDDIAKLATCHLQYGTTFYPELEYEGDFKIRILNDLIDFRCRKNDYNSGVQLQLANFKTLYPIIYFDLRNAKERMTGDPKKRIPLQVKRSRKRT